MQLNWPIVVPSSSGVRQAPKCRSSPEPLTNINGTPGAGKVCRLTHESLIVVCSPESAASSYVNDEIEVFRRLGRDKRIFAFIVDVANMQIGFVDAASAVASSLGNVGPGLGVVGPTGKVTGQRADGARQTKQEGCAMSVAEVRRERSRSGG